MAESKDFHQRHVFLHFARYNQRANSEMYVLLSQLTDRARKRDCGAWFGSIHKILNHLLVGDMYWLNRFKPIFPESQVLGNPRLSPPNLSWVDDLHEDFELQREERIFVDGRIVAWFEELPLDRYREPFQYRDSAGELRNAVSGQAFEFLFLHQIHHRGQISQVLDTLGVPNNLADNGPFLEGPQ